MISLLDLYFQESEFYSHCNLETLQFILQVKLFALWTDGTGGWMPSADR